MSKKLCLMMITVNPEMALLAEAAGVERIFVDMEVLGKSERQGHLNTHKAAHTPEDVGRLRAVLSSAEVMVRVNPLYERTGAEIEDVLARGAQRLMLPMFRTAFEVRRFLELVKGRVPVTLLAETPQALTRLQTYVDDLSEGAEIYIGLNDLSLGMGLNFLFEPLAARMLDPAAELLRARGIPFGFGGIARVGYGELPVEWVLGEHVRLGSGCVILSRAFHGGTGSAEQLDPELDLAIEVEKLRAAEGTWRTAGPEELEINRQRLCSRVFEIASRNMSNV